MNPSVSENSEHLILLFDWIADLDMRLIEKFSLPSQPRSPRPKLFVPWAATLWVLRHREARVVFWTQHK